MKFIISLFLITSFISPSFAASCEDKNKAKASLALALSAWKFPAYQQETKEDFPNLEIEIPEQQPQQTKENPVSSGDTITNTYNCSVITAVDPAIKVIKKKIATLQSEVANYKGRGFKDDYVAITTREREIRNLTKQLPQTLDYNQGYNKARKENKPLVVSVGCQPRNLSGVVCCYTNRLEGFSSPCVVVGQVASNGGVYCSGVLPATCNNYELIRTVPQQSYQPVRQQIYQQPVIRQPQYISYQQQPVIRQPQPVVRQPQYISYQQQPAQVPVQRFQQQQQAIMTSSPSIRACST